MIVRWTDPSGLDTLVIINGPTSGNPFGHSAIAVTGSGVYSYGNNPNDPNHNYSGTSLTDYLNDQVGRRDTQLFDIPTTPDQEQSMVDYLNNINTTPNAFPDNCAARVENALQQGNIPLSDPYLADFSPIPFPASLERSLVEMTSQGGATYQSIPMYSNVPANLSSFNPQ